MTVATEVLAVKVFNISAGTPIPVAYPLYVPQEVFVYYGKDALLAEYNVDYTVTLGAGPNFYTFTIIPTAALLAKINGLISLDPDEVNFVTIRRELPMLTASTPPTVANSVFASREFDRVTMKLQQLTERMLRSIVLPPTEVGDENEPLQIVERIAGRSLVWDADAKKIRASVYTDQEIVDFINEGFSGGGGGEAAPGSIYPTVLSMATTDVPVLAARGIYVTGYATPGIGGAWYRRVAVQPAHDGWFLTKNGQYYEINELVLTPEMFGAIGDANFTVLEHLSGADDTAAVAKAVNTAAVQKRPLELRAVYRTQAASLVLTKKVTIYARGPWAGFVVLVGSTDSGIWDRVGCRLENMRVHVCTLAAKPANEGHMQSCVLVCDKGYFMPSPQVDDGVRGFYHKDLLLTRRAVSGGGGSGWYGIGNVADGHVGEISDTGSVGKHSILISLHWSGQGAGYGQQIFKTWHPTSITIGTFQASRSISGLNVSSSRGIRQSGKCVMTGGERILYLLPGDETDSFSDPALYTPNSIGKDLEFLGPFEHHSPELASGSDDRSSVEMFSQGTSALGWRKMPDDPTVGYMGDLDMRVTIGNVTLFNTISAVQSILGASYFRGALKTGILSLVNCDPTVNAVQLFSSQASKIDIEGIVGACRSRALRIVQQSNVKVGFLKASIIDNASYGDEALYSFGALFNGVVSGVHAAGAVKLVLAAPLAVRMSRDTPIRVGGTTVFTTAYCTPGIQTLQVSPLPALAGGEAIVFDHTNRAVVVHMDTIGGFDGADLVQSSIKLTGRISKARGAGLRFRSNCNPSFEGLIFDSTGFGGGATAASDIVGTNSNCSAKAVNCVFGVNAQPNLAFCLNFATAEGLRRFVGVACTFAGYATAPAAASAITDYALVGCTDKVGALLNNP